MNTLLGYSYKNGGQVSKKLKPIPKGNPGLAKLPQEVRNRMGYMQEGGSVSPALAALLRKRAKYDSQQAYEEALREEAKNKERASLFGGFGSLAGGLGASALAGLLGVATGGLALPLIAGAGAAAGKKIGASSGYQGKLDLNPLNAADYKDYSRIMDDEDLIYGSDAFKGLESSARDYTRSGMEQDAIVSGLKTGLMAGFGGDSNIYAKTANRFAPSTASMGASQLALPNASNAALGAGQQMSAEGLEQGAGLTFGRQGNALSQLIEPNVGFSNDLLNPTTNYLGQSGNLMDLTQQAQGFINPYNIENIINRPFTPIVNNPVAPVVNNPVANQLNTGFINYANNELDDYLQNRYNMYNN